MQGQVFEVVPVLRHDEEGETTKSAPGFAVELSGDVLDMKAGDVAFIGPAKDIKPGCAVLVLRQGGTELGLWQQSSKGKGKRKGSVIVQGHPYDEGKDCFLVGRVVGVYRGL